LILPRGCTMPIGEKHKLRFGPFELDAQCGQLRKDGVGLKLQGQPVQILEILMEKPGQLVTRDELRQRLWASDTFVDFDHSLNTAIKKLRHALGDEADTPHFIETLPKRGYRFIAEVADEDSEAKAQEPSASAVLPIEPLEQRSANGMRRWKRVIVGLVAGLLVVASCVGLYLRLKPEPRPRIVGARVLTKTGIPKGNHIGRPLIIRDTVYFSEERPSGWIDLGVSADGGALSASPAVNGYLQDVSPDGSHLLSLTYDPKRNNCDIWAQPLPTGLPYLIIQNTCDAIWSEDGGSVFFRRGDGQELYRVNSDGMGLKRLATLPEATGNLHISPDGSRIRFTGPLRKLALWEVGTDGHNLRELFGGRRDVFGGSWTPDGNYYFFRSWDGERWSLWAVSEARHWWKRSGAARPYPLTFGPMSFGVPAISNDGKQLFAVGKESRGELSAYDPKTQKFVPYLGGGSICYVDFSRDGHWMTYVSYPEGTLWRSRIDGTERRQLTMPPLAVSTPRWSPDGKLIVFTDLSNGDRSQMNEESLRRIYAISADGGAPELLLAGRFEDSTWSPDGSSIAYAYRTTSPTLAGSEVRILDLKTQRSATVPGSKDMWSPRWSPDGKHLVALIGWPVTKQMLYSFASNSWEVLATGDGLGWESWSRDSRFVYAQDGESWVCISISNHKKERIISLRNFRGTAYFLDRWNGGWFGLTPDGSLLTTRDTGSEELYSFDLDYK